MPKYQIIGQTLQGSKIDEVFERNTPNGALGACHRIFGKLKNGYQIIKLETIEDLPELNSRLYQKELSTNDKRIIELGHKISNNEGGQKEYEELRSLLSNIINRAIHDLWKDQTNVTHSEMLDELTYDVIREFLPKFDPGKGKLLSFIRRAVRKRINKRWVREVYVNSDKRNKRKSKKEFLYEYQNNLRAVKSDNIEDTHKVLAVLATQESVNVKMNLAAKRQFFEFIIKAGIHREILKKQKQITVLENCYGEFPMTEKRLALVQGVTQQTIHTTKIRAENNVFKGIKTFSNNQKTSVF